MLKKAILLISTVVSMVGAANAQKNCASDDVNLKLKAQYPEIARLEREMKEQIDRQLSGMDISKFAKTTIVDSTWNSLRNVQYHIPIVFHIIHDYGSNDYVSDNAIYAMVAQMNKLYNKQNADTTDIIPPFKGNIPGTGVRYAGNAHITWHLPTRDPAGNATTGITRRRSYLTHNGGDQAKFDQWAPDSYMNVWLIEKFGADNAGAGAYAYQPPTAASFPFMYTDGVIGIATQASDVGTLSHELGHELFLSHPWGSVSGLNGNQPPCGDDESDDTPPTRGHTTGGGCSPSNLYDTFCATGYFKTYTKNQLFSYFGDSTISTTINYPDTVNSQNIMDYTFCDKMFTHLQVLRMRATLNNSTAHRDHLITATNMLTTGALLPKPDLTPVPDYSFSKTQTILGSGDKTLTDKVYVCANEPTALISLTDRSWRDTIVAREWTLSNGATITPNNTSTTVNAKFTDPGWVTVTLKADGNNSGSTTITRTNSIYIASATGMNPFGYSENFAPGNGTSDKWPMFNYYDNAWKWEIASNAGFYDNYSIRYKNYDPRPNYTVPYPALLTGTPKGDVDDVFSPPFDLTGPDYATNCNLNFMSAGAYNTNNPANMNDTFEILYSTTCGNSWILLKTLTKGDIANNGPAASGSEYRPTTFGEWKLNSIPLTTTMKTAKTMFRFRYKPGAGAEAYTANPTFLSFAGTGNDFYMDLIHISAFPTGVDELAMKERGMVLVPNPTQGNTTLVINGGTGVARVQVTDVTGKIVYTTQAALSSSVTRVEIPASALQVKGMYLVHMVSDNKTQTEKLVVY
jgi:hypothetical protein